MSFAVVVGPALNGRLEPDALGAEYSRVRLHGEAPRDRAERLRELLLPAVHTVVLLGAGEALEVANDSVRPRVGLVADHLNLTGDNPLVGPNDDAWGPRFPDLTDCWNADLRRLVRARALDLRLEVLEGVLASVRGGAGTRAERSMWKSLGAEMAAEAFADEAIVARHAGRRVVGLLALGGSRAEAGPADPAIRMLADLVKSLAPQLAGEAA